MDTNAALGLSAHLSYGLDTPLPDEMFVGHGVMLHLRGWCYSSAGPLAALEIVAGGVATLIANHSWARTDVFAEHCPGQDQSGYSLLSGFEGFVPFAAIADEQSAGLTLRATLQGGVVVEQPLGSVRLRPSYGARPTQVIWPDQRDAAATGPRVAICMATFNPPLALFKAQVASLQAQTHSNWVCIVTDDCTDNELYDRCRYVVKHDPRFVFFQNRTRHNFYHNFQEGLRRTPADAEFVALCDQDDVWRPEKLRTLLDSFAGTTQLVYSDARVVDQDGKVRSETFWRLRRNNHTDLPTLMVANTVTGAASMFRASLLADIIPFPTPIGPAFHDHWIGLVALIRGGIGYVDAPLYDYVQHADGVIGHNYNKWPGALSALRQILRAAPRPRLMARTASMVLKQSLDDYVFVLQKVLLARTLLLRNPDLAPGQRAAIGRFAQFETSMRAALDEKVAAVRARRPTLNLEGMFLWSMAGVRLRNQAFRYKRHDLLRLRIEHPGTRLLDAMMPGAGRLPRAPQQQAALLPEPASEPVRPGGIPVLEYGAAKWICHNITPLTLDISGEHPKRVNLLLATINFQYVFGGYIGMFNLALRLAREGYRTRIVLHEQTEWNLQEWRRQIQKYPGVTTLFDEVEIISRFDRTIPVESSPQDRWIATNCWAAHVAHGTAHLLDEKRFLFMVQEYEPYFLAMNSISAVFQQAYTFPQVSLFSTELLQEFFRNERIGVFAKPGGDRAAAVFSNAIQTFRPTLDQLQRTQRRLLFYGRPEEHASRNLYELGMIALATLVRDPRVNLANWSFHGIGSLGEAGLLELAPGIPVQIVPKTSLEEYIRLMPSFDVGLSLMLTPHPSLVPLEMASAGMWAVTNTFANKTAEKLRAISPNLIGVEPTIEGICDGLVAAMGKVEDFDARLAGAKMTWPTQWDAAFPAGAMVTIREFLGAP